MTSRNPRLLGHLYTCSFTFMLNCRLIICLNLPVSPALSHSPCALLTKLVRVPPSNTLDLESRLSFPQTWGWAEDGEGNKWTKASLTLLFKFLVYFLLTSHSMAVSVISSQFLLYSYICVMILGKSGVNMLSFGHWVGSNSSDPKTATHPASLSFITSQGLLRFIKFMYFQMVMLFNHLILCCPLLFLPSIISSIRVFSNELAVRISWPKYRSLSFSIRHSNEYSGLISFRIDWFDILAVQGTIMTLLQHHNLKASISWHLACFMVQLSHMTRLLENHSFDFMDHCHKSDVLAF